MGIDQRIAESVSKPIEIEEKVEEDKIKKTKSMTLEDKLIVNITNKQFQKQYILYTQFIINITIYKFFIINYYFVSF